MQHTENIF